MVPILKCPYEWEARQERNDQGVNG
jgi:hypothetical protein